MEIMHQTVLLSFAWKFGCITEGKTPDNQTNLDDWTNEFNNDSEVNQNAENLDGNRNDGDPGYEDYQFLPPSPSSQYPLSDSQLQHLREHYGARFSNPDDTERLKPGDLDSMDRNVKIWHRCCFGKIIFHCDQYRRQNSTRLNNLVRIRELVDANAHCGYAARQEQLGIDHSYVYIQFFCEHNFRGKRYMLAYSKYHEVDIVEHAALVKDLRSRRSGFHDVVTMEHLCAKVVTQNKTYFIDSREAMMERLEEALELRRDSHVLT
jgi:hypothetical protein